MDPKHLSLSFNNYQLFPTPEYSFTLKHFGGFSVTV